VLQQSELRSGNLVFYNGREAVVQNTLIGDLNSPGILLLSDMLTPAKNKAKIYSDGVLQDVDGILLDGKWIENFGVMREDASGDIFKKLPNGYHVKFRKSFAGGGTTLSRASICCTFMNIKIGGMKSRVKNCNWIRMFKYFFIAWYP